MLHRNFAVTLLLGALVLALVACGGKSNNNADSESSEPQTAEAEVVIKATNWEFDKSEYIVPKDVPVKIILEMDGGHGIQIPGTNIKLGPGRTSAIVTMKEGTYEFKCNIMCGRGHDDMVAKFVVQ